MSKYKLFAVIPARDARYVKEKIEEMEALGLPFIIVCGEKIEHKNVVYRPPKGKYDAINYAIKFIPKDTEIVVFNDVDTKIINFHATLKYFEDPEVALVYAPEQVICGPQVTFYKLFNKMRKVAHLAGSGELFLIRREILEKMLPLRPCKGEDTYILFKTLELKQRVVLCEECIILTKRTKNVKSEEAYRRRSTTGVYQALAYTNPPVSVKLFYTFLPIVSPLLLLLGRKGYYWFKGIMEGIIDYCRGDRSGFFQEIK
jgi:cellulose synthase/poly-beta-1,6-N-acetylglucosamine synthase-like glycosyltransferase